MKKGALIKSEGMKQVWHTDETKNVGEEVCFKIVKIDDIENKKAYVVAPDVTGDEEVLTFVPSVIFSKFTKEEFELDKFYISKYKGKTKAKAPNSKTGKVQKYNDFEFFEAEPEKEKPSK